MQSLVSKATVEHIGQEDLSTISEQDEVSIAENFIKYGKPVLYNLFLDIICSF